MKYNENNRNHVTKGKMKMKEIGSDLAQCTTWNHHEEEHISIQQIFGNEMKEIQLIFVKEGMK
jgi:hypothetical protein